MKTILVDAIDGFVIETQGGFQIFKEMHELLETFPNRKIILTGANDEEYKKFGLDKMPYEVFTLKHDPEKTDPKYFKMMLQHFGLSKDEVVYFEHNPEAVKSAESVGITSYAYDPGKKDLQALQKFLAENLSNVMCRLQVGVKILLKNTEGKYLLMRRSPEKYPETQKWDVPGGRIDPGTPLLENLSREVLEETGLVITNIPRLVAAQDILKVPGRHVVRLTYVGETQGTPRLSEEHTAYAWSTFEEMRTMELLDNYVKELISRDSL